MARRFAQRTRVIASEVTRVGRQPAVAERLNSKQNRREHFTSLKLSAGIP
ncbi:MAG: hypothetical protein ACM3PU_04330 [Gemmatimonadota bacterium]